jgi:DNA-binding PadR family transcriptional regulator
MEQMGFVKAEEKIVDNRARRVYSITEKGRKMFEDIRKNKIHGTLKEFMKDLVR